MPAEGGKIVSQLAQNKPQSREVPVKTPENAKESILLGKQHIEDP